MVEVAVRYYISDEKKNEAVSPMKEKKEDTIA